MNRATGLVVVAVLAVTFPACRTAEPPVVETVGVVTGPDGKPLGNVLVQFHPEPLPEGQKGLSASAVTDPEGKFALKSDNGKPGAVIGEYKVTVVDNAAGTEAGDNTPQARPKRANRIPARFASVSTTPLTATVEAGKQQVLKVSW